MASCASHAILFAPFEDVHGLRSLVWTIVQSAMKVRVTINSENSGPA